MCSNVCLYEYENEVFKSNFIHVFLLILRPPFSFSLYMKTLCHLQCKSTSFNLQCVFVGCEHVNENWWGKKSTFIVTENPKKLLWILKINWNRLPFDIYSFVCYGDCGIVDFVWKFIKLFCTNSFFNLTVFVSMVEWLWLVYLYWTVCAMVRRRDTKIAKPYGSKSHTSNHTCIVKRYPACNRMCSICISESRSNKKARWNSI